MNTTLCVRIATREDVPALAAIEAESFSDAWPASAFHDALEMPSSTMLVATIGNLDVIGYCMLLTAADQSEIANLAVATNARRCGVGVALLRKAIAVARTKDVVAIFLEVRASNDAARALYAAQGFSEIGRRRGYYQRPSEDALVLQWSATTATKW